MTVKELSKLYWLTRELEHDRRELKALEDDLAQTEEKLSRLRTGMDGLHSPALDAMPHGSGTSSPVENTVTQILTLEEALKHERSAMINLQARLSARNTLRILEYEKLTQYINTIEDPHTRKLFSLRFVDGLSWQRVSASLGDGYLTDTVKKTVYRYIKTH